jgi:hypothetical protein
MRWGRLLHQACSFLPAPARTRPRRGPRTPLRVEPLEGRTLPAARLTLSGVQTLLPGANVNVSRSTETNESELIVDINPADPLNVAGFVHNTRDLNQIQVFASADGGLTWARRLITHSPSPGADGDGLGTGRRFDPSLKFDAAGNLFVAYGVSSAGRTRLVVARSTDGGASFGQFTVVDDEPDLGVTGVDKWHLTTGPAGPGSDAQAVYVAYTLFSGFLPRVLVSGSRDGGLTFTAPAAIDDPPPSFADVHFAIPAVGADGGLNVAWVHSPSRRILLDRDPDGLWSDAGFGTDRVVRDLTRYLFRYPVPASPRRGIFTGPVLAVDRSGGPYHGRLYVAFADGFPTPAAETDIYLASSDDGGATWTAFAPGARGNVEGTSGTDFLPWVAVDADTGGVSVAYYTTHRSPTGTEVVLRLAASTDGGATFARADLSDARSRAASADYVGEFLEYLGLAVRHGTAHGFWADNRGRNGALFAGDLDAYTASAATYNPANALAVTGDDGGPADDKIVLRYSPANPQFAEVWVNGRLQWAGLWASLGSITIDGGQGGDRVRVEDSFPGVTITVVGGAASPAGADVLLGSPSPPARSASDGADNPSLALRAGGKVSGTVTGRITRVDDPDPPDQRPTSRRGVQDRCATDLQRKGPPCLHQPPFRDDRLGTLL